MPIGYPRDLIVSCSIHGPMHYRPAMCQWNCVGFDGERCEALLTDEEASQVILNRPLERVAHGEFGWTATRNISDLVVITIHLDT